MAQWLAQATHNRLVTGSNPVGPTAGELDLLEFLHWNDEQGSAAFICIGLAQLPANELNSRFHALFF